MSTLTPFLYQTRTLSTVTSTKAISIGGVRRNRTHWRDIKGVARLQYSIDHQNVLGATTTSTADETSSSGGFRIRRTTLGPVQPNTQRRLPFEVQGSVPDGKEYAKSTIKWREFPSADEGINQTSEGFQEELPVVSLRRGFGRSGRNEVDDIDFVEADQEYERDEIGELTQHHERNESTITDSERYAFQRIFTDIFGRGQTSGVETEEMFNDASGCNQIPKFVDMEKAKLRLDNILTEAVASQPQSKDEKQALVERYPPSLRAAAAKAIGLTDEEDGDEVIDNQHALDIDLLETLRNPERDRVEALMKGAKTDFELWEVMEKEVFSLVRRLGLEDTSKPADTATSVDVAIDDASSMQPSAALEEDPNGSRPPVETAPTPHPVRITAAGVSPLALYGPLYPYYLLLGLRLLDRSFVRTSPLVLSVLPKIKSLGLISQVLGASTQLYNELLRIHRFRFDDHRAVINLLREMDNSGLEVDNDTLKIVEDIMKTQSAMRNGLVGASLQSMWWFPEFAPRQFLHWRQKIADAIEEKAKRQANLRY